MRLIRWFLLSSELKSASSNGGPEIGEVVLLRAGQGEPQRHQILAGVHAERGMAVGGKPAGRRARQGLGGPDKMVSALPGHLGKLAEAVPARPVLVPDAIGLHLRGDEVAARSREHHPDQVDSGGAIDRRRHPAGRPGDRRRARQHQPGRAVIGRKPPPEPVARRVRPGDAASRAFCWTERCCVM